MASIDMDRENNERDRVFSKEEFDRLLAVAPAHLKPIVLTAYYTGMRRGELLKLTWDRVETPAARDASQPLAPHIRAGKAR